MEIKPNELRAGNLLMGEPFNCARVGYGDGVVAITAYGIGMMESDPEFAKKYKPIELTPEWLERCGFEKVGNNKYAYFYQGVVLFRYRLADGTVNIGHFIPASITQVHQLQNLYFALTGQELEIKPLGI